MDAYISNGDVLCENCGDALRTNLNIDALEAYRKAQHAASVNPGIPDLPDYFLDRPTWIRKHPKTLALALGFDPSDESAYDSGTYPKGPYADGGGEADTPQHCGHCRVFLDNPLTEDGKAYVAEALVQYAVFHDGAPDVIAVWRDAYAENLDADVLADKLLEAVTMRLEADSVAAETQGHLPVEEL